jgi:hypothetical protein
MAHAHARLTSGVGRGPGGVEKPYALTNFAHAILAVRSSFRFTCAFTCATISPSVSGIVRATDAMSSRSMR